MRKKEIDYVKLDALLQFKVTITFCADYLGVSHDTIERRVRKDKGMSFAEYHELKLNRTGLKLQQKAIEMALHGNTAMMIFALKNIAKWRDNPDIDVETTTNKDKTITVKYKLEDA